MPVNAPALVLGIDYTCTGCQLTGVKLWRQSHTMASCVELKCARCAAPDLKVGSDGMIHCGLSGGRTDQLPGSLIPAIPAAEATFWGYLSITPEGVKWWRSLPTYPPCPPLDVEASNAALQAGEDAYRARKDAEHTEHLAWVDQMIRDTAFVVAATHQETHQLWYEHSREGRDMEIRRLQESGLKILVPRGYRSGGHWEQISRGHSHYLGELTVNRKKYPHAVTLWWFRIDGHLVAFYEPQTLVVHRGLIEEWVTKTFAHCRDHDHRWAHSDAANFGHCLQYLCALNEAAQSKAAR